MTTLEAELRRRLAAGGLADWILVADALNTVSGLSDPVIEYGLRDKLESVKTKLDTLITNTGDLKTYTDGIEALLTSVGTYTDGLEAVLATISGSVDGLEGFTDGIEGLLTSISGFVDGLEGMVDGLESGVGTPADVEAASGDGSTIAILKNVRTRLGSLEGYLDNAETLLTNIGNNTDGLEGFVDGLEALLTAIRDNADTVETLLAAIRDRLPAALDAVDGGLKVHVQMDSFARIKNRDFRDDEQVRYDIPVLLASAFIYTGLAPATAAVSDLSWAIIRTEFDANQKPAHERIRENIRWDQRTLGW